MLKISNEVTITICTDSLKQSEMADTDVFYSNKKTVQKILNIAQEQGIEVTEKIYLEEQKRFSSDELTHIAQNLYAPFYSKYEKEPTELSVFLANNPYSEMEYVATQIVKLVKEKGYNYKDISVITKNIEQYASLCKAIFNKYQIPIFIDQKKDLSQNILVKLVISLLDVFAKNWSYESVFGYLKTNFTSLSKEEISYLEVYCLKWGTKGSKWYNKEWDFYDESEDIQKRILYSKEQAITPLLKFKDKLKGTKSVTDITKAIYEFLLENQIDQKLQEKSKQLEEMGELEIAKEYETSWKIVIELLDEIVLVLGDTNISFDMYAKILRMGLKSSDLGKIPGTADQVTMGDVDRSRSHKVKAVFVIGMNDGMFPNAKKEEGFLDDKDREKLKEQGLELAKGTIEQLYDDNFNIYKAFTTAEEKTFLSYVSSDSEGKSLRPSMLINKIKRIFPNLKETSDIIERKSEILLSNQALDELLINLRKFCQGEEIDTIWFEVFNYYKNNEPNKLKYALQALNYTNKPEKIQKEILQKFYGDTLHTSVSRLEQYQSCAFSYYLKYGLKLNEKSLFEVKSIDTGNFMHDVIDDFFDQVLSRNLKLKEMTNEEIHEIIKSIINEKLTQNRNYILRASKKYQVLTKRLEKLILKAMKYIIETIINSDFEIIGNEVEFGKSKVV